MKKNIFIPLLLLPVFFLTHGPVFAQTPVNLGGVSYINIDSFSREKGLRDSWDPIAKNAVIADDRGEARLHVGSEYVLSQNRLFDLGNKVRFFQGAVMAPLAAPVSSRKLRSANFYVLKRTECPSVLVEAGYLTNSRDENRLKSPVDREHLAEGIVRGLMNYKNEFDGMNGFTR